MALLWENFLQGGDAQKMQSAYCTEWINSGTFFHQSLTSSVGNVRIKMDVGLLLQSKPKKTSFDVIRVRDALWQLLIIEMDCK
ncbi:hypothetical protein ABEB36_000210 [Hypothenemus hampei]|uniref:Uncharacterized protein n=1 Tax=Hypothenemus hampei TaxID=57062 RepID=A0ABD1FAJ3_HYPHA